MKENTNKTILGIAKWLLLMVATVLLSDGVNAAPPATVVAYSNATTRIVDGMGNPQYFAQSSGYEYGDEVVLGPTNTYAYLTEFKLEYYAAGLPGGATMQLQIYANDGAQYGTNADGSPYFAPSTRLYQSAAFEIVNPVSGFGTYTFNQANSGFAVVVPRNFTWTVQFANVGGGTAGLALYGPTPTVGSDYDQYWESPSGGNSWVSRDPGGNFAAANFGASAVEKNPVLDKKAPVIVFGGPADKFKTNQNHITVYGTANDPDGPIALVMYKVGAGNFMPATVTANGVNSNWSFTLNNLNVWANGFTITAKVIDSVGKQTSITKNLTYYYQVLSPLHFSLSEANSTDTLSPWADGTTTNLEVGQTYTVTVAPRVDLATGLNLFWYSNSILTSTNTPSYHEYPALSADPKASGTAMKKGISFSFTMETNMDLTVYSVTNRFLAAAGQHYGLFKVTNGPVDLSSAGYLTIKTDGKRGFSGKVYVQGEGIGFAGTFGLDGEGDGKKLLTSALQPSSLSDRIHLRIDWDGSVGNKATISGYISNTVTHIVSDDLAADRVLWTADHPATNYSRQYTMILPPGGGPSGYSRAYFTIDDFGRIKLVGKAADGEAIKAKTAVISKDGYWPFFAQNSADLSDNKLKKGILWGWLGFLPKTDNSGTNRLVTTDGGSEVAYVKKAVPMTYFSSGFTNISTARVNSYANTLKPSPVIGWSDLQGVLRLTGGNLATSVDIPVYEYLHNGNADAKQPLQTFYKPTKITSVPWSAKTTGVNASGVVNGSFYAPDDPTTLIKFYGIAMPEEKKAYGYFLRASMTAPGGSFTIQDN